MALIFALAFGLRMAYVVKSGLQPGLAEMTRAAIALAEKGVLGDIYTDDSGPSTHVSPLHPMALACSYRLLGYEKALRWRIPQALSILGASLCMALLPLAAVRLKISMWAGAAAGLGLAVLPVYLWLESSGSWEQPYAALLLVWLLILTAGLTSEDFQQRFASVVATEPPALHLVTA